VLRQKQYHAALMLYQADYGGATGYYGRSSRMNLPLSGWDFYEMAHYGLNPEMRWSPCGIILPGEIGGVQHPTVHDEARWINDVRQFEESTIILFDMNCNRNDPMILSPLVSKRGIVTTLGGQSRVVIKKGYVYECRTWCDKSSE